MFKILPFIFFVACGSLGFFLWYKMLLIMKSNGHEVNYFWISPSQFVQFNKVIEEETDPDLRRRYRALLWSQIALVPIYIIGLQILFRITIK